MKLRELLSNNHGFYPGVAWAKYHEEFAEEFALNEGRFKSLSQDDFEAKLKAHYPQLELFNHPHAPGNTIIEFKTRLPALTKISELNKFIELCGWFVSNIVCDNERVQNFDDLPREFDYVDIVLEPFHSHPKIETPKSLYHATPFNIWNKKISHTGLSAKSNSSRAIHPDRVYFMTDASTIIYLIRQLAHDKFYEANDKFDTVDHFSKWAVLEIDTSKIRNLGKHEYFQVFIDTKFLNKPDIDAVYSLNSIPPTAIKLLKTITI